MLSKAKLLLYILNNFKFYISQFFKYFFALCKNLLNAFTIVIPSFCKNAKELRLNKIRFYNLASLILDCHASRCVPHFVCFSNGNSHNDDKNNFAILITRGFPNGTPSANPLRLFAIAHNGLPTGTQKRKPVVICKLELQKFNIKLVKTFLTSITFDSLSRKIKNPCLVINKKYFKIMPMAKEKK